MGEGNVQLSQVPVDRLQPRGTDSRVQGTRQAPFWNMGKIKYIEYAHTLRCSPLCRAWSKRFGSCSLSATTTSECQDPRVRSEFGRMMGKPRSVSLLIVISQSQTSLGALSLPLDLHASLLTILRPSPPFHTFPPHLGASSHPAHHVRLLQAYSPGDATRPVSTPGVPTPCLRAGIGCP